MFGSWVGETDRPVYGLTKNITTHNPLRVATHEYAAIARDVRAAGSWSERAGRVFRGPGWQPASAGQNAAPAPASAPAAAPAPAPAPGQEAAAETRPSVQETTA